MTFIEKEAKLLNQFIKNRRFTSSARSGMAQIIRANMLIDDTRGILLPSYIGVSKIEGSGVFDPVQKVGIDYEFYRLNHRLSPDLEDIEMHLRTGKYQLIFLIHYFGFNQTDVKEFVELSHKYGVKVIEDCAHVPPIYSGNGNGLGFFGDYAIYSIHKNIATKNGGFFLDHLGDISCFSISSTDSINLSSLEKYVNTKVDEVAESRLRNYIEVSKWVREFDEIKLLYDDLPDGICPLNCPVIVSKERREKLYFSMIEKGVLPTALYHTLIDQINRDKFKDSYFISKNILNLPTHPDIRYNDFEKYYEALTISIKEVFNND